MDRNATSTEDLQALVMFLKGPDYLAHPYASQWLAALTRRSRTSLSSRRKERAKTYQAHLRHEIKSGGSIWETIFHLGPPGSAEDIVEFLGKGDAQAQTTSAGATRKRKAETTVEEVAEVSGGPRKGSRKRNAVDIAMRLRMLVIIRRTKIASFEPLVRKWAEVMMMIATL